MPGAASRWKPRGRYALRRPHVVVDTVKGAEDGGGLIVRVYEAHNQRGPVTLSFARELARVWECDLMEEDEAPVEARGEGFTFEIKPYQIRSFRVRLVR